MEGGKAAGWVDAELGESTYVHSFPKENHATSMAELCFGSSKFFLKKNFWEQA